MCHQKATSAFTSLVRAELGAWTERARARPVLELLTCQIEEHGIGDDAPLCTMYRHTTDYLESV